MGDLIEAVVKDKDNKFYEFGVEIGKLYTDHGLPLDMAMDRLDYPKEVKLVILNGALHHLVLHKRNSGATDKAIDRQRRANRKYMTKYNATGEIGLY